MSELTLAVLAALAGGAGACTRAVLVDRFGTTAVVNLPGSLLLGLLLGAEAPPGLVLIVGTGFLGALTTFSAWMLQVTRSPRTPLRALGGQALGGLFAGAAGMVLGRAVVGALLATPAGGPVS